MKKSVIWLDKDSGSREKLALLAWLQVNVTATERNKILRTARYDASNDRWAFFRSSGGAEVVPVRREANASLEILEKHGMSREAALALVGGEENLDWWAGYGRQITQTASPRQALAEAKSQGITPQDYIMTCVRQYLGSGAPGNEYSLYVEICSECEVSP